MNRIIHGDVFDLREGVSGSSIDLIVCDGPYGVTVNSWDNPKEGIQQFNLNLIKLFKKQLKIGEALYLFGKPDRIDFVGCSPYG